MTERQRRHLDELVARYTRKTAKSKALTQAYRPWLADSRATVGFRTTTKEMLYPLARHRARGSRLWDVDGNEYVDVTMGMGVHLFGHDPEFLRETIERQVREGFELGPRSAHSGEVAALFCELTGMERATFTNSGTEACMTALRLARARTGRTKIVMFAGSYHGHSDGTLAQTQEIDGTLRSFPVAPGIPAKVAEDVLVLDYGTPESLEIIRRHRHELAAVMVEPIQSRRPEIQPREFLHELRRLTAESGIALIFDEMICGFRLHLGGAQAHFGVRADLATYGKVVGGGLPIGVVAGAADFMDGIDGGLWRYGDDSRPERETTFFGGTFCQHPLAMAAAKAVLTYLKEQGPGLQETLNARTARFAARLNEDFERAGAPIRAVHAHSLFRFQSAANLDLLYYQLVDQGVYVWEWRNCFLSTAHSEADLDFVAQAVAESVAELQRGGFLPEPPSGGGGGGAKGFWDRQGKPAIAPVVAEKAARSDPSDAAARNSSVDFSLYFFGHYPAEFRAGKYDLAFAAARFADRHGFSALWFPERHFHPFGGLSPNPSVLAAALARETERIALRAGSVVLPLHHPLRVAEEWALVDNLSGGRVGLSYASGWHPNDFALAPEAYGRHRDLMFERIEEVRRLWRGEALKVRDGAGKEVELRIFPRPAHRELAEWITIVNNPDTWRRAGTMGVGVLTNLMGQTVEGLAGMVRIYREALAAAGHPPERGQVTLLLHTHLDADPEVAIERARWPFYDYLKSSVGLLQNMMASEGITADFDRMAEEDLEYILEMAFQRYVRTSALIGSPESCAPIVEHLRAVGVDEIACLIDFGVEPARVLASLPSVDTLRQRFAGVPIPEPLAEPFSFPLTASQGDLYTVAQVGAEALRAYYESGVLELRGPLDLGLLRRALQGEVDRHEALRTVFPPPGETQTVLPALRLEVPLFDASGCPPERQEEIVGRWLEELARDPFDLARGPLIRASVMRLSDRQSLRHVLSIAVHHLVADGLSIAIVLGEALAAYESMRAGRRPVLPRPLQFREYVAWLEETGTAEQLAADEAYWLSELMCEIPGELPVFDPPTDRPRPPVLTFGGRRQRMVLAAADRERLVRFGRRHGATLYVTLLAAWTAVLHRWTGQDDLIVGSAQAHRPLEGGDRLVGHCTDIMPLRSRGDDPTFEGHLAALRRCMLGAHDHGGISFSRLVRLLKPRRDPGRSPMVSNIFNLDPAWAMGPAGGLEIAERSPAMPYVKFDLAIHSLSLDEGLVIYLDSRRDLFDAATIERLAGCLRVLLDGVMEDPARPIRELPWMMEEDRVQLTSEMTEVVVPGPQERMVHELFAEVAAERPDAVAIEAGDRCLTYGELDGLANGWARRLRELRELGIAPDARVATVLERSPELIVAWLATLKAGGAYVPLDPGFPEERLGRLLAGSGAVAVLTDAEHQEIAERAVTRSGAALPILNIQEEVAGLSPLEEEGRGGEGLAYVTFTSGSTGEPKGVAIPHRAVVRLVRGADYAPLRPDDRVAHLAHVAFDATTFEVWGPLLNGGRVVVLDRDTAVSPHRLAAALRERGVTVLFLTTALFNQLVAEEPAVFAGLRCVLTGGEAADPSRFRAVLAAGPPGRLVNIYGPTECTTFALWEPVAAVPEGAASVPIGRPIVKTRAAILDGWEPVPPGVEGELCLGGDGLARGYLGRPDLTAERFVPDPRASTPGARLYRTGDRARMGRDGRVEYLGRVDRQVKIRGFRIEPGEVEAALAAHPGVREVAVVVDEDRLGEKRLVAWFVPSGGAAPAGRDLRDFLAARLPGPLIPAVFAAVPSLPLTPSGKVDRRALASRAPEQEPQRKAESAGTAERRAPLSFAQERLWFFDRLAPGSIAYNLPTAFHLRGPLAPAALAAALAEIVRRHEALRTVFTEREGGEPEQVVLPFAGFPLPIVDLSALPDPQKVARRLIHEESRRPFDLGTGPLLRAFLLRLGSKTHSLLLAAHHIVGDGWSFGVLGAELAALYRASSSLPPLPIQYADFAVWQRSWLQGEILERLLADWRRRLAGHPGVLELPADRPRPLVQSFRGAIELLPFNSLGPRGAADFRELLRRLGRRHEATPFMVALAAYQVLLLGYTGEEDLLVGTPVANRNRGDIEGLIGFFVNTLPLRTDLKGDPTFTGLVERVRAAALEAFGHQDLPFEKLVEALAPDRDLSLNPLVQVAFAFQNNALPDPELAPGLACEVEFVDGGASKFDLTLFLEEQPDGGLAGGFEYATDLFDAATVRRIGRHFLSVVRAAAARPEAPISELLVLTPEEQRQIAEARRIAGPRGEAPAAAEPSFEAPRTPVEQIVAGVWSEVLALERVGVRVSFFDLGGHSLLAGRVLSRLRAPLGVDLSLSEFFQDPTVAGLARRIEAARRERHSGAAPPLVRRSRDAGPPRLSFAQERLWLVDQLQPGSTTYHIALPLLLTGRLDVPVLTRSLAEIARRHEVLRTRFATSEGSPVQMIEPVSWLGISPLPRVDLDGLPAAVAQTELERLAALRTPFDLARGPLLRTLLVKVSADEHAFLVTMHHAIADGWSLDVMTRELSALYRAFSEGRPSPLPEPPIQYADFAQWQRQWLRGEVVAAQLAWWRERLGENPPPLALPTDRPRPAVPSSRGESRGLLLPPELGARLEALARRHGGTLFIALLAGFQALLHRHTHQERIAVGTPVAGRTRMEVEELIGLFVNTLVLATGFGEGLTGAGLLERARETTLGAFDHQDLPFEQLVAALARDRDPGRQPLFQVMFVLQNQARTDLDLRDVTLSLLSTPSAGALFDLTLGAMQGEVGIVCGITWAADLFDPSTILRFLEQYRRLLEALVEDPGRPVADIPLLSAAERHQLEVEPPIRRPHEEEALAATVEVDAAAVAEARRAELERRRSEVASRRGQLSADRKSLLRKWVGGGASPAEPKTPPRVNPLVELRSAGRRPPLFLVHAAGGIVHEYVNLAERLDPDQPLYAFQSPGVVAGGELFATVPEMAARYREAVRSVQPHGPYRLGGYCVGGAVAFEMARQLRAEGEEVDDLVLIDSPGPLPAPMPPPVDDADMLASFVRTYGNGVEIAADELRAAPPEEWIDRIVARAREMGIVGESFDAGQLRRQWEVMRSNVHAIAAYVPPGPLPLGAILFRATQGDAELREQPLLGWERWLEGTVEVVDVEGGHLDVFQEPAVDTVARGLQGRTAVDAAI